MVLGEIHSTEKRGSYAVEVIKSAVITLNDVTNTNQACLLRCFLPYCFAAMGDDMFLPLNRNYKPIGLLNGKWVDYHQFPFLFIHKDEFIDFESLRNTPGFRSDETYFLFKDNTSPFGYKAERVKYIEHLCRLFDFGACK